MRRSIQPGPQPSRLRPHAGALDAGALALHRSPARRKLDTLEKEHERLLSEIRKKKQARDASESAAREVAHALHARLRPLREALISAASEVHAIFQSLLGEASPLNRRDKARVRRVYGPLLQEHEQDAAEAAGSAHAGGTNRGGAPHQRRAGNEPAEAGYTAPKPQNGGPCLVRTLFRKLAQALHPDKVQDSGERATLTAVMKEVTRAYELGDVARLVELERSWLAAALPNEPDAELARRTAQLLEANRELRQQLRALSAELKALRDSVGASLGARGAKQRGANDWTSELLFAELERELGEVKALRDLARSFRAGEIGLSEFLAGPAWAEDELERAERLFEEALESGWGERGAHAHGGRGRQR
ncbi:MAG TPA: J domain-containing protein [Polyangiaceae bacterium]|nr:J domain-containing protein [Polyangiaceae bacterium]